MPNYQIGNLLASGGDVLTQLMDIIKTYVEARGWTTNLYEDYRWKYDGDDYTGKRLHIQKTIDGIARYMNLRSFKNQEIYDINVFVTDGIGAIASTGFTSATETVTLNSITDSGGGVIALRTATAMYATVGDTVTVAGSASYNGSYIVVNRFSSTILEVTGTFTGTDTGTVDGPSRWDHMPGAPGSTDTNNVSGSDSVGGAAADLPSDVLSYFLFSENSGDNIYLICQNSTGYTGICFGTTTEGNYFLATSYLRGSGNTAPFNLLLTRETFGFGTTLVRKKDDSEWYQWPTTSENGTNKVSVPAIDFTNTDIVESVSPVQELLFCSPDIYKGNNPLIPAYINITVSSGIVLPVGDIPGIKYVNMLFVDSLTELTFGGDVYKLFRLYSADDAIDATVGLALLK